MTRRTFRQTLLCKADVTLDRTLDAQRVMQMRFASPAAKSADAQAIKQGGTMELKTSGGVNVQIGHRITIAAMLHLARIWPLNIDFDSLLSAARASLSADAVVLQNASEFEQDRQTLAENLLQSFIAGVIELHTIPASYVGEVSDVPEACPLARYQATQGEAIATRRHQLLPLDPLTQHLVQHLDGATSHQGLLDRMVAYVAQSDVVLQHQGEAVTETSKIQAILQQKLLPNLKRLAECGLLIG
ncbi:MAG: hypothetical protein R3C05_27255 [Pirellulaceae bacterium]